MHCPWPVNFGLCQDANCAAVRHDATKRMAEPINFRLRPPTSLMEYETVHVHRSVLNLYQRSHANLASRDKGSLVCPWIVSSSDVGRERYRLGHRR